MRTLRSRLLVTIGAAVLVATVLTVGVAALLVRHQVSAQALTNLERQADAVAAAAPVPAGTTRVVAAGARRRLRRLARPTTPPRLAGVERAIPAGEVSGKTSAAGRDLLYAARITASGGRVVLVRPAGIAAGDWRPFLVSLILAGLGAAAVAVLFAFALARRLTRPVRRLSEATRAVASGRPDVQVPIEGHDELADLSRSFNAMADELAQARDAQRRFLLSVSHELKTPLTAIMGYAEGLGDGAVAPEEAVSVIAAEAQRLERLVRDLLDLGRVQRRDFPIAARPIDLGDIADRVQERFAPRASDLGVAMDTDVAEASPVTADPDRLLQAVSNLVENALRITPAGGTVKLRARPGLIEVSDTGPGLAAEDLPRAFERFYLHDRYRSDRPVGTGLGLALVKELTEAMGGTVTVSSALGAGTTFAIRLAPAPYAAVHEDGARARAAAG